jgi:hypothetical protein
VNFVKGACKMYLKKKRRGGADKKKDKKGIGFSHIYKVNFIKWRF